MEVKSVARARRVGKKIRQVLSNSRGEFSIIWGLVVAFILILIFAGAFATVRTFAVASRLTEAVSSAVVASAIDNSVEAFGGVREGNSSLYTYNSGAFAELYSISDVYQKTADYLKATNEGGTVTHYRDDGRFDYSISNIAVEVVNPNYDAAAGESVKFRVSYRLNIRLSLLASDNFDIIVPVNSSKVASWKPLF